MTKSKSKFFCKECGYESSGWLGKCPGCGQWNTFVEEKIDSAPKTQAGWLDLAITEEKEGKSWRYLSEVSSSNEEIRQASGLPELDRVLGGGFVQGSLVLVGGDPGIGKSTLLLQTSARMAAARQTVLYISGEESPQQIRLRSDRLGLDPRGIKLMSSTNFEQIAEEIKDSQADFVVVDSIQTIYSPQLSSAPGSVSQVRESTAGLLRLAKGLDVTIVLLGHVTKEGAIAGPRVLEHMVDTVLYFEGEQTQNLRILRCVKNRFGNTDELGIFEMREEGLVSVANPSLAMLAGRPVAMPGAAITASLEGTRPLMLEVQALMSPSHYQTATRMSQGLDRLRLNMLLAVIEKFLKQDVAAYDCYLNVVGGLKVRETACDLAVAAAILSSLEDRSLADDLLILGEVGLSGEIRPVSFPERRVGEALRLGWKNFVLPASAEDRMSALAQKSNANFYYVSLLDEAMDVIFQLQSQPEP